MKKLYLCSRFGVFAAERWQNLCALIRHATLPEAEGHLIYLNNIMSNIINYKTNFFINNYGN